jgi:hypothetical protein
MLGIVGERLFPRFSRPRERVVHRGPPTLVVVALEHRKVMDPEEREDLLVDQPELLAQMRAQRPEDARGRRPGVGCKENRRAGIAAEARQLLLGEELRDRRAHLALLVVHEIGEPLGPPLLRHLLELRQVAA